MVRLIILPLVLAIALSAVVYYGHMLFDLSNLEIALIAGILFCISMVLYHHLVASAAIRRVHRNIEALNGFERELLRRIDELRSDKAPHSETALLSERIDQLDIFRERTETALAGIVAEHEGTPNTAADGAPPRFTDAGNVVDWGELGRREAADLVNSVTVTFSDARTDQNVDLFLIDVPQLGETQVQGVARIAHRADGAGDERVLLRLLDRPSCEQDAGGVDLSDLVFQPVASEFDPVRAEGVRLDDLRTGAEVLVVDLEHEARLGEVEFVETAVHEHAALVEDSAHRTVA